MDSRRSRAPRSGLAAAAAAPALLPLLLLLAAAGSEAKLKPPTTCPANCLSCQSVRGSWPGIPKRNLLTAPVRVVCKVCDTGFTQVPPFGVGCGCSPGSEPDGAGGCTPCPPNSVSKPSLRPGGGMCKPCSGDKVPSCDKTTCVSPTSPAVCPAVIPCFAAQTCARKRRFGAWENGCGTSLFCGACGGNKLPSGSGDKCSGADPACLPAMACPAGKVCGFYDDGCGSMIPCGDPAAAGVCPAGGTCSPDQSACIPPPPPPQPPCVPKTACAPGKVCGMEDDGCGGQISCSAAPDGSCPIAGQSCAPGGLQCVSQCVPKTMCSAGTVCGTQSNDCGGQIICGFCATGWGCTAGTCTPPPTMPPPPCVPATTCTGGQVCGVQTEPNCGKVISCGACAVGSTCAPNGASCVANTPECIPNKVCAAAQTCGMQADSCGGFVSCGACPAGAGCDGKVCITPPPVCTPMTPAQACGSRVCGVAPDGCGGTVTCGTCSSGTCSNDGTTCVPPSPPVCTPIRQCTQQCGTQPNGCGGSLSCPICPSGQKCEAGTCVPSCKPILGSCTTSGDCCFSDTDTFCEGGVCKIREGGRCAKNGMCGMCHPNCGVNTEGATCAAYGFPLNAGCNHSGKGGGGTQCGNTFVCCTINQPTTISVGADNHCIGAWPPA
ncbi:MAG: hypothetical protein J3K34DRAFT_439209 [Monoraphidium minutum]|nr:MAG: hypothetical protein J3K34DRAFT_439209 [Monoraphidium minutum]